MQWEVKMRRVVFALSVISGLFGVVSLGTSAQRMSSTTDPKCTIDYLDGQLIQCCEVYPGHWECRPYK